MTLGLIFGLPHAYTYRLVWEQDMKFT